MNKYAILLERLRAELQSVEAQQAAASHAGDHTDATDYENIANGIKRSIRITEELARQ